MRSRNPFPAASLDRNFVSGNPPWLSSWRRYPPPNLVRTGGFAAENAHRSLRNGRGRTETGNGQLIETKRRFFDP